MKKILAMTAVLALSVGAASANQAAVGGKIIGKTNNAEYPLLVRGTDGHDYYCRDEIVVKTGNNVRECISRKGGLFAGGLSASAPLIFLVGGVAAAAAFSGGGSSTNGTN